MTLFRDVLLDPDGNPGLSPETAVRLTGSRDDSADVSSCQSPGLGADAGLGAAFELKFHIDPELADRIEHWAGQRLSPDSHGDRGRYSVTSLYCDTPRLDVFYRAPGYRRVKFRLRRYDASTQAFLERKRRRGSQVIKRRTAITADELSRLASDPAGTQWAGDWFHDRVRRRGLQPTACVNYRRSAFFGLADNLPVRMTLDRHLVGIAAQQWHIPHVADGSPLLPDGVLLELKFHLNVPPIFRELMPLLPTQMARVSKYRRCVSVCGIGGVMNTDLPVTPKPNPFAGSETH